MDKMIALMWSIVGNVYLKSGIILLVLGYHIKVEGNSSFSSTFTISLTLLT